MLIIHKCVFLACVQAYQVHNSDSFFNELGKLITFILKLLLSEFAGSQFMLLSSPLRNIYQLISTSSVFNPFLLHLQEKSLCKNKSKDERFYFLSLIQLCRRCSRH